MNITSFQRIEKPIGISDFRSAMARSFARAKTQPLVVSARRGEDSFVVLSVDAYNKLIEERENTIDSRELSRLVKEQKGKKRILWKR